MVWLLLHKLKVRWTVPIPMQTAGINWAIWKLLNAQRAFGTRLVDIGHCQLQSVAAWMVGVLEASFLHQNVQINGLLVVSQPSTISVHLLSNARGFKKQTKSPSHHLTSRTPSPVDTGFPHSSARRPWFQHPSDSTCPWMQTPPLFGWIPPHLCRPHTYAGRPRQTPPSALTGRDWSN